MSATVIVEQGRERARRRKSSELLRVMALLGCLLGGAMVAKPSATAQAPSRTAVLDRVVADVDEQAILASDVDDEMRFSTLLPGAEPAADNTPQRALNRVIDRTLIDQQRVLQPGVATVSQKEVDRAIDSMRKQISAATNTDCESEDGWKAFLAQHGFTPDEIQDRMRERLAILKFINVRFGVMIQVSNADVRKYYDQVLIPQLKQSKQSLPDFRTVTPKIREILRQQRVSKLIDEWLKSLRAEGQVKILDPAYAAVGSRADGSAQKGGQ